MEMPIKTVYILCKLLHCKPLLLINNEDGGWWLVEDAAMHSDISVCEAGDIRL